MRTLLVALLLTLGVLGLNADPAVAVDPSGPFCIRTNLFGGAILKFFALPMGSLTPTEGGGVSVLLSGLDRNGFVPLTGSGFSSASGIFQFTLSGAATFFGEGLEVFDGSINISTGIGTGRCYQLGSTQRCGAGTDVTYTAQACP